MNPARVGGRIGLDPAPGLAFGDNPGSLPATSDSTIGQVRPRCQFAARCCGKTTRVAIQHQRSSASRLHSSVTSRVVRPKRTPRPDRLGRGRPGRHSSCLDLGLAGDRSTALPRGRRCRLTCPDVDEHRSRSSFRKPPRGESHPSRSPPAARASLVIGIRDSAAVKSIRRLRFRGQSPRPRRVRAGTHEIGPGPPSVSGPAP